jgi:hypothetical protein
LVVYGREALTAERKAAEALARLLSQRANLRTDAIDDQNYDPEDWQALILVGHPDRHLVAAALMASHGIRRPSETRPGPEGYTIRQVGPRRLPTVIIVGEGRACLYGVGAFLRTLDLDRAGQVGMPYLELSSAPELAIRGSDLKFWQENRVATLEMGDWTLEQWEEQIVDLALWGINLIRRPLLNTVFDAWLDEEERMVETEPVQKRWQTEKQINRLIHDFGMEAAISYPPNTIAAAATRPEWHHGSRWSRVACPALPEARDRILYERLQIFKELEYIEHLFVPPYTEGRCHCPSCQPWIKTYLDLVQDTAKYLHHFHPNAKVWISDQGLNENDQEWLWETLAEEHPMWLHVIQHGPGSTSFLNDVDTDSESQGLPPFHGSKPDTFMQALPEFSRRVPLRYQIALSPDITHTFQLEENLEQIDPAFVRLHTYESPFARPVAYHDLFHSTASSGVGTALYSEGLYDDLNKALWAQWAWSPAKSPWSATLTYTRWWFGERAAKLMTETILLSEANWEMPIRGNDQIEQVVLNVDQAKLRIPSQLQKDNWRWTLWRLRALLDLLAQRKVSLAQEIQSIVYSLLSRALNDPPELAEKVKMACEMLDRCQREKPLEWLKSDIRDLDNLLYYQIGLRLPAAANLDVELTNLGWEFNQLQQALHTYKANGAVDLDRLRRAVMHCLNYENPGPGGYYDDCGHIGRDPHFVAGHRVPYAAGLDAENRPSANTFAAGFGETEDVVFSYRNLDPSHGYRVRLTLVFPHQERQGEPCTEDSQQSFCAVQRLYASGFLVHDNLRLPNRTAEQYAFDLPRQAYSDGRLELRFVPATADSPVAVSEIWLIPETS